MLRGEGSVDDIVAKYNISSHSVLRHWMKQCNDHIELKDYDPKREVYMAGARKKTSLYERKEIVEYCLSHGKNYKDTAAHYDVSYSQVYDWVGRFFELRAGFFNDVILFIVISEPIGYKGSMFTDFARDCAGIFTKCCGDGLESGSVL